MTGRSSLAVKVLFPTPSQPMPSCTAVPHTLLDGCPVLETPLLVAGTRIPLVGISPFCLDGIFHSVLAQKQSRQCPWRHLFTSELRSTSTPAVDVLSSHRQRGSRGGPGHVKKATGRSLPGLQQPTYGVLTPYGISRPVPSTLCQPAHGARLRHRIEIQKSTTCLTPSPMGICHLADCCPL